MPVTAGVVYNGGENTYTVDAATGDISAVAAIPAYLVGMDAEKNYYFLLDNSLSKFDSSFTLQWVVPITASIGAVDDQGRIFVADTAYVAAAPLNVYRIDPATGAVIWTTDVYDADGVGNQTIFDIQAVAGQVLVAWDRNFKQVFLLAAQTGSILTDIFITTSGQVYLALSTDGEVYAFITGDAGGTLKRVTGSTWDVFISPGENPEKLVCGCMGNALYVYGNNAVYRYNTADGALVWNQPLTDVENIAIDNEGGVYSTFYDSGTDTIKVRKHSPEDGSTVWTSASGIPSADFGTRFLPYGAPCGGPPIVFWENFIRCAEV